MSEGLPLAVYPAMLAGTMGGHLVGIAFDAAVGTRSMWAPLACSVLIEAVVGARYAGSRLGHALTPSQRLRLTITYSLVLTGISLPLALWLKASRLPADQLGAAMAVSTQDLVWIAAGLVGLVVYTAVRYGLMSIFAPRPAAPARAA